MDNPTKTITVFACGNVLDPHIRIEGKCRACKGTGHGEFRARCRECGKEFFPERAETGDFTQAEFAAATAGGETTPCGHDWTGWREQDSCYECMGTGEATDLVRLTDLLREVGPALEFIGTEEED